MDDIVKQARDHAAALLRTYDKPVIIGDGVVTPARVSECAVTKHPANPDGPEAAALLVSLADEVVRLRKALAQYHAQDALFSAIADIASSDVDLEALDSALAGEQGDG